ERRREASAVAKRGGGGAGSAASLSLQKFRCGEARKISTSGDPQNEGAAVSPAPPPPPSARFASLGWSPSPASRARMQRGRDGSSFSPAFFSHLPPTPRPSPISPTILALTAPSA